MFTGPVLRNARPAGSLVPVRNLSRETCTRQVWVWAIIFLPRFQAAACFSTLATCPNRYESTCFRDGFERNKDTVIFQQ